MGNIAGKVWAIGLEIAFVLVTMAMIGLAALLCVLAYKGLAWAWTLVW